MTDLPWVLSSPADMHLHLRQGDMLKAIAPSSTNLFAAAMIMPNLVPPVTSLEALRTYREDIMNAAGRDTFSPLMTLFFRDYTEKELAEARDEIHGIKLYPDGVTTNSASGIHDITSFDSVFSCMQEMGIPLMVHGETHGFVMDREREFLVTYSWLSEKYPRLKIVMEHITTAEAVALLDRHENLHATVTLHHLLLTLDDMAGGLLNPHLFCKPILKRPEDRDALQAAVLNGHVKVMFGSDSAPHPVDRKECCGCAAGVFSAPVALAMLADFFDRHGARDRMQAFVSDNARICHGLDLPPKRVAMTPSPWIVPQRIGNVVPFMAGKELAWQATLE